MKIETFGLKQLSRDLLRLRDNAQDMTPAYDDVHQYLLRIQNLQFSTQGQFSGRWQPLAPSTVRSKAAAGLDPRILHATLRLRKSMTQANHPDHVYQVNPNGFTFESAVPYAVYHQRGAPENNLPKRRVVEFSETVKRRVMKILQEHLMSGVRR